MTVLRNASRRSALEWLLCSSCILVAGCSGGDAAGEDFDGFQPLDEDVGTVQSALRTVSRVTPDPTYLGTSNASSSTCSTARPMAVFEPADAAPGERFPVFLFTIGLNGSYTSADSIAIAREAARRGYVAASLNYANEATGDCTTIDRRANCAYNPGLLQSATRILCSRPLADCSRGTVTAGHSLGGALAVRARNFDSRVRATFTLGTANGPGFFGIPLTAACMNPNQGAPGIPPRALANDQWRLYAGETEFNINNATNRNAVTGQNCAGGPGTIDCLRPDGSGWYQVGDSEVADGTADHCYQLTGNGPAAGLGFFIGEDPNVVQSCDTGVVDTRFLNGAFPWSVGPAIDFLTSRVDP